MGIILKMFRKINLLAKKLTLFDKIVIALVILGVIIFAYIFFRKTSYITVTLKVGEDNIYYPFGTSTTPYMQNLFYAGMKEKDGFGRIQAEVLNVKSYMLTPNNATVYLQTKLKTTYTKSNDQHSYKGTPVLVGSQLTLYLDSVSIDALVTSVGGKSNNIVKKTIIAEGKMINQNSTFLETNGIDQYIADTITVGDMEVDSQNEVAVKVLEKIVKPSTKTVVDSYGHVFTQKDPTRKDVTLKLEINATVINDKYYIFYNHPVSVGEGVPICTSKICYYPTITKIDDGK